MDFYESSAAGRIDSRCLTKLKGPAVVNVHFQALFEFCDDVPKLRLCLQQRIRGRDMHGTVGACSDTDERRQVSYVL